MYPDFSKVKAAKGQKRVGRKYKRKEEKKARRSEDSIYDMAKRGATRATSALKRRGKAAIKRRAKSAVRNAKGVATAASYVGGTVGNAISPIRASTPKGGMNLGHRKAAAAEKKPEKKARKKLADGGTPRSAEWKADTNPNNMANKAGTGASAKPTKPAYAPKTKALSGAPSKPQKYGKQSPTKAMRKQRKKKEKFNFGKAIRRGFGQLG